MTILAGSAETLANGASGTWFTATDYSFLADVDNQSRVYLETRRNSGDTSPKRLFTMQRWNDSKPFISGPCSVPVASIPGRQYRFVVDAADPTAAGAVVAADA